MLIYKTDYTNPQQIKKPHIDKPHINTSNYNIHIFHNFIHIINKKNIIQNPMQNLPNVNYMLFIGINNI